MAEGNESPSVDPLATKTRNDSSSVTPANQGEVPEEATQDFRALKHKNAEEYKGLDVFPAPLTTSTITMTSNEVTSCCPVTEQPDWYVVEITYAPQKHCIESKSLKLFLHTFRNKRCFCETMAHLVLTEVVRATKPIWCIVIVTQKPRGGVSIESKSSWPIGKL
jgi:7-cyano-7-deazaguanine reductase